MIEFGEDLLDVISENFTGAVAKPLKSISLSDRHAEATEFAPALLPTLSSFLFGGGRSADTGTLSGESVALGALH